MIRVIDLGFEYAGQKYLAKNVIITAEVQSDLIIEKVDAYPSDVTLVSDDEYNEDERITKSVDGMIHVEKRIANIKVHIKTKLPA